MTQPIMSVPQALTATGEAARSKIDSLRSPGSAIVSGLLGGAYIGVGVMLMISAAGSMWVAGDPFTKLISGLVFSVALLLVVFAGAELITSTMMVLVQGVAMRRVTVLATGQMLLFVFVTNLVGAAIFSAAAVFSGVLDVHADGHEMLAGLLAGKAAASPAELLLRGVLCNTLVCLAVWMASRVAQPGAKIALIVAAIVAFVTSGFEHVVANMSFYWMGVFLGDPNASLPLFATNMWWVGLGNFIGGGVVVGLATWAIGGFPRADKQPTPAQAEDTPVQETH